MSYEIVFGKNMAMKRMLKTSEEDPLLNCQRQLEEITKLIKKTKLNEIQLRIFRDLASELQFQLQKKVMQLEEDNRIPHTNQRCEFKRKAPDPTVL